MRNIENLIHHGALVDPTTKATTDAAGATNGNAVDLTNCAGILWMLFVTDINSATIDVVLQTDDNSGMSSPSTIQDEDGNDLDLATAISADGVYFFRAKSSICEQYARAVVTDAGANAEFTLVELPYGPQYRPEYASADLLLEG